MTPRLLLVGIDAGDLVFIREHADALPTLRRFLRDGREIQTRSPIGLSGSVWPTFYTGKPPGEHGLYQHLVWNPERMGLRLISPEWCRHRPFWADLEAQGHQVVVLDVPYSFAGHLEHGVEIVDWGTQGQTQPFFCSDPAIQRRIRREFGTSPIGRETPVHKSPRQLERVRRSLVESAAAKGALTEALMQALEWDVFITVFAETHRGGHALFGVEAGDTSPPLLDVYRAVDRAIGGVLAGVDLAETSVMLFAVHGMTRDDAQSHVVRPLLERMNRRFMETHLGVTVPKASGNGLIRALRRTLPPAVQLAVGERVPDAIRRWVVERELIGGLDWATTPGFALRTDIRSELRLNLRGREARGLLEPGSAEHRAYVQMLFETFGPLRDAATGALLVDEVVDIRELYPGDYAEALPDYVITWRREPSARSLQAPALGNFELTPVGARGGDHTDDGFVLLMGPAAEAGELPPLKETHEYARFVRAIAAPRELA